MRAPRAKRDPWTAAFPWVTPRFVAIIVAIAVVYAASAFVPVLSLVAIVAGALALGLLVADAAIAPRASTLDVQRAPLDHLALGVPASLRYSVVNRGRAPARYDIIENPVDILRLADTPASGIVGPDRRSTASIELMPIERGDGRLGPIFVSARSPLGLVQRRWIVASHDDARVLPDLRAVERYGTLARRDRLVEAGFRKMRLRGMGGEFDSLREYRPDDAFRAIDWKATARRGKLMVAQYDVERSQNVVLVLDAGRLMTPRLGSRRKFDYAVTAALSVASLASLSDDKVGLLAFAGDVIEHIAPRSGKHHANGLTQRIYGLQPRFEESDYERAFAYLRRRQPKRSLIIVFTDMFDPVASATVLANMSVLSDRHLVVCVLMNDAAIEAAVGTDPSGIHEAYRASVAFGLLAERKKSAAILAAKGVATIDVPAADLTVALINTYIEIKSRSLL